MSVHTSSGRTHVISVAGDPRLWFPVETHVLQAGLLALGCNPRIHFLPEHFEGHAAGLEHQVVKRFD